MRVFQYPLRLLSYLFSLLPFPVIYWFSDILYLVLYRIIGYRRQVVRSNLQRAFPAKSLHERAAIERSFYRNLCDVISEFLKIPSITSGQLRKRMVFTNPEILVSLSGNQTGVIGISSHMCNWEWGALAVPLQAYQFTCLGIYKPLTNRFFDEWFKSLRSRFGMHLVPMKSTYRELKAPHPKPVLLNLIADQTPTLSETEYEAPFLGISTPVFLGAEKIARATGMPVIFFAMRRVRRGYYEVTIYPLNTSTSEHSLTHTHLAMLEKEIRDNPGDWLWSHRRWKHSGKTMGARRQTDKV